MTPFEEAGYTKETKFRVLRDWGNLKKGDIVTLGLDDGTECPWFKTEDGRRAWCWLPNMAQEGCEERLEVYEELNEDLTPFEKAGYTKDTKFKVLVSTLDFNKGDIVTLAHDYGSNEALFKTKCGKTEYLYLPFTGRGQLQVHEDYTIITKALESGTKSFYIKRDIARMLNINLYPDTLLLNLYSDYIVEDGKLIKSLEV